MSEHTHRVVRGTHRRSSDDGGPAETFEPGVRITPTERELALAPDRFEPLDDADTTEEQTAGEAESDASDDAPDETPEDTDTEADADTADESDEDEAESGEDESDEDEAESGEGESDAAAFTAAEVEDADYDDLRTMAKACDDVNGNWGEDRLRTELLDRAG